MQFRHEVKHEITCHDMLILRQRLRAVMRPDPHATGGRYEIRSLYFDDWEDRALREKLDGACDREKYRIRLYDHDPSVIHLERKCKQGGLGYKEVAPLTPAQTQAIVDGDIAWMAQSDDRVIRGLYTRIRHAGLAPRVLVDYLREPYVFAPGNVRVTLDYGIRTALRNTAILDPHCPTVPVPGDPCILEVKWDQYLPDVIRDAVQLGDRHSTAYSKYAACRAYDGIIL